MRLGFFVLKILVNGVKLPFLMQGKVTKRYFPFPASPDFVVGVARFIVQHPFTETLKGTLLLKFSAIRPCLKNKYCTNCGLVRK